MPRFSSLEQWVLAIVGLQVGVVLFAAALNLNPFSLLTATTLGALGGGVGAALAHLLESTPLNNEYLKKLLPVAGFVAAKAGEEGIKALLGGIDDKAFYMMLMGITAGAVVGAFARRSLLPRSETFATWSFVICVLSGTVGGLVLAVPASLILSVLGRRRYPRY